VTTVLVTGATGLIGSNVCSELVGRGYTVRALVREGSDVSALDALGVETVRGNIISIADVRRAAHGCSYSIHTAALVVGGPERSWSEYHHVNVTGSFNVFDAARENDMARVVSFASQPDPRVNQYSPESYADDAYQSAKLQIANEVVRRSAAGQDVIEISPGAAFGPAPTRGRALLPPGFNSRIVLALRGQLSVLPNFVSSFDLASDVARSTVNALTRGASGERYSLGGRPDEVVDVVTFLNAACERAGVDHRVRALTDGELDSDDSVGLYGPSMVRLARQHLVADGTTSRGMSPDRLRGREVLGHDPVAAMPAVEQTVDWMLSLGII
jgi:dihydroflavonol-4-reductase/farnesol dehydrogenase